MNTNEQTANHAAPAGAVTFAVTAMVFLALGCLMLAGRPGFLLSEILTGHGQAWIQLMVYGFGLPAVFAAVYWALPQAFGLPLYSPQSVFLHFGFHVAGLVTLMLLPLAPDMPQASMGATFLACGAVVFAVNVGMTLRQMARPDAASAFVSTICVWLVIATFLGAPFAATPPLPLLGGTTWGAGLLVLLVGGVMLNALLGLALRVTSQAVGAKAGRSAAPWYALSILNLGLAWTAAAATFGTPAFLGLCAAMALVGSLIYLGDFWGILQRRPDRDVLGWDSRILLTAVWMVPAAAMLLVYTAAVQFATPVPAVVADAAMAVEPAVPAPLTVSPLVWTVGLATLLGAVVPGLVALIFQLQKLRAGVPETEPTLRARLVGQILLAAFFNYAVGAGLLVVGAWGGAEQMLGLGAVFLAVGTLGFLGNFLHALGDSSAPEDVKAASPGA